MTDVVRSRVEFVRSLWILARPPDLAPVSRFSGKNLMADTRDTSTSVTLLLRVRKTEDQEAWTRFVERYGPQILAWCRRCHLQDSDAADVAQEVLIRLVRAMGSFAYEPGRGSFRGWLKTVTHNAVRDLVNDCRRHGRGAGDTHALQTLADVCDEAASEELERRITQQYEQELLQEAEVRVQARVQPHTWQAYHQTAVGQQAPQTVAEELGMSVAEVYVARSRVLKMLSEEVERLDSSAKDCVESA